MAQPTTVPTGSIKASWIRLSTCTRDFIALFDCDVLLPWSLPFASANALNPAQLYTIGSVYRGSGHLLEKGSRVFESDFERSLFALRQEKLQQIAALGHAA